MAEIKQLIQREDLAATWTSVNPILASGEIGVEGDTGRFKIGDGVTAWNGLGYARTDLSFSRSATTVTVEASGDDAVLPAATIALAGVMSAADKSKLDGIAAGAEVNVQSDWSASTGDAFILNKPTLGTAAALNVAAAGNAASGEVVKGNDTRLSDARVPTAHTHVIDDITGFAAAVAAAAPVQTVAGRSGAVVLAVADVSGAAPLASPRLTGSPSLAAGVGLSFEGTVNDGNDLLLQATAVTGSRTLTLPDESGTLVSTGSTGVVTGTMLASGAVANAQVAAGAGIVDTKLATISTAGKVANSATTATSANTGGAIVARDGFGNFSAGTITAALVGNASTATALQTPRTINGVSFDGTANITIDAGVTFGLTFNNSGSGAASGATFNGTAPMTISRNTIDAAGLSVANSFTGANDFVNATGQTFRPAATQDGIRLVGRAGGTNSRRVEIVTEALSASRTLTLPDASGTVALTTGNVATATALQTPRTINGVSFDGTANITISASLANVLTLSNAGDGAASGTTFSGASAVTISHNSIGAVAAGSNTAFTGANTFTNTTGQTFRPAATQDGIRLLGRAGGTSSWLVTVNTETLSGNRTLTLPNASGTVALTTGNVATATTLQTARTINGVSFNGSSNITIAANTGNSLTFNNGGSGAASGATFNGGSAVTISHNTLGAVPTTRTISAGSGLTGGGDLGANRSISIAPAAITSAMLAPAAVDDAAIGSNVLSPIVSSLNGGPLAGFRNAIINGNFDVWQRGVGPTGDGYLADRWFAWGVSGATLTQVRRALSDADRAIVGWDTRYALRLSHTGGGVAFTELLQRIEGVRTLAGQEVTLSFDLKASVAGSSPFVVYQQSFGTGGSPSSPVSAGSFLGPATTSFQHYTFTFTLPSITGKTLGNNGDDFLEVRVQLPDDGVNYDITKIQLEPGPVDTSFERRPYGLELALCQRYYEVMMFGGANYATSAGVFRGGSPVNYSVKKRATPTRTVSSMTYVNCSGVTLQSLDEPTTGAGHFVSVAAAGAFFYDGTLALDAEL